MRDVPPIPDEHARLAALAQYDLTERDADADVDEIVQLASRLYAAPIVMVSVIDHERQYVKAAVGLDACEADRRVSFCAHTLTCDGVMVVPDAHLDERFATNPFVTGEPGIRFYAGVALVSPQGHAIGSLCIIDRQPRPGLSAIELANLRSLALLVQDKLEMRRLVVAGAAGQSRFENIASTSPDGIVCADAAGRITFWNAAAEKLFDFPATHALGSSIDIVVPHRLRGGHGGGLTRVAAGGAPRLVGTTVDLEAARADGTEFPIELSLSMWHEEGAASFGAIIRDLTDRRANETRLFALAHLDALTGLANRSVLSQRITECIDTVDRAAVLMVDLDGFKDINDTLGHSAGDEVLREVSRRIASCGRPGDTVARLGGDEFAILMPDTPSRDAVGEEADCLLAHLVEPVRIDGHTVHVSGSVGVALYPDDGEHVEDLLAAADLALYQAKNEGRNCRRFFTPHLREAAVRRRAFEGEIRAALEGEQFELHYQPQVRMSDGAVVGLEALLRWRHPELGLIGPDSFLASVNAGGQAADVGQWVLERACADAVRLCCHAPGLRMGVNLFGSQFRTGRLAEDVRAVLAATGLPPEALELEITENIILRHDETMLQPLRSLRDLGVGLAFDDFGTGFASLSFLKRFPLTRLKIDRSFIADVCEDPCDAAIVRAMVRLASDLDLDVVAEGVEERKHTAFLRDCGCDVAQGYLFGRPLPFDNTVGRLATGRTN